MEDEMRKDEFIASLREAFTYECTIHTLEKIEGSNLDETITGLYDLGDLETVILFFEENYTDDMVRIGENHNTKIISFEIKPAQTSG
jgi:hypothetical protein